MNINISIFSGRKKIAKQKKALEAARIAILEATNYQSCQEYYCDDCPVSSIGGEIYDKNPNLIKDYDISKLICPLRREYSK